MEARLRICASVLLIIVGVGAASTPVNNLNPFEDAAGVRVALRVYDECSRQEFSPCLKKKAITFLDRLGRMDKFSLVEGVTVIRSENTTPEPTITEEQIEQTLPRTLDRDSALTNLLLEKLTSFISSRTIQTTLPKMSVTDLVEEGRGKQKGGGGGLKGMMGHMMMGMAGKMMALVPMGIAGLFLLAGKALITAKIALLLSGIIALKKLISSKQGGGGGAVHVGGGGGGWQSGGGGWQSGGGGWDKRSFEAQKLAYKAYSPK